MFVMMRDCTFPREMLLTDPIVIILVQRTPELFEQQGAERLHWTSNPLLNPSTVPWLAH